MLSVCFWGVRGSISCPGPDTVVFGGNTTCLEIRAGEKGDPGNRLIIIDSGTGIRPLGQQLADKNYSRSPVDADIFISHTHWDHIMGFPMFTPLYIPETRLRIRGPLSSDEDTLEAIIGAQLSYKYWPIRQSELAAKIRYDQIKESELDLGGGLKVISKYLNHPILCLGYRFEYQGKSIVAAFDHEPFRNLFPSDPDDPAYDEFAAREGEDAAREENEKIIDFFKNADVLIHDAQYSNDEYLKHLGWGHSSYETAIDAAQKASAAKLIFFHHDPNRTDRQLQELETKYCKAASDTEVSMAREGLTIEV